jgi:uncharacterized Zn-finger protein
MEITSLISNKRNSVSEETFESTTVEIHSPSKSLPPVKAIMASIPQRPQTILPTVSQLLQKSKNISESRRHSTSSYSTTSGSQSYHRLSFDYTQPLLYTPRIQNQQQYLTNPLQQQELKKYKCQYPNCTAAFKSPSHLERHVRVHTGEKPFHCTFEGCTKSFSRKDNLSQHILVHKRELGLK